jgi:hypothetical protein
MDVKNFNLAMLGKQGWRLMTNPDTLCARVLKGKYYNQGDFLTVGRKKNAYHTWRAILEGRKVLEKGLIRRIGDGTSTNIWEDRWLPTRIGGKPICRKEGATSVQVVELLSENGQTWNEEALHQNLLSFDVAAAQRVPLGRAQSDFWAWSRERHGLYTVRLSYRLLSEDDQQTRAHSTGTSTHSVDSSDPRWKNLWKQKVPPKVRVFWWKVMHDYMSCQANLQ